MTPFRFVWSAVLVATCGWCLGQIWSVQGQAQTEAIETIQRQPTAISFETTSPWPDDTCAMRSAPRHPGT